MKVISTAAHLKHYLKQVAVLDYYDENYGVQINLRTDPDHDGRYLCNISTAYFGLYGERKLKLRLLQNAQNVLRQMIKWQQRHEALTELGTKLLNADFSADVDCFDVSIDEDYHPERVENPRLFGMEMMSSFEKSVIPQIWHLAKAAGAIDMAWTGSEDRTSQIQPMFKSKSKLRAFVHDFIENHLALLQTTVIPSDEFNFNRSLVVANAIPIGREVVIGDLFRYVGYDCFTFNRAYVPVTF